MNDKYRTKLLGAAAYLLAMCFEAKIENDMFLYTTDEQNEAIKLASEILRNKMI